MKRLVGMIVTIMVILGVTDTSMALLICGQDIITAPYSVKDDATANWHQQAFNEQQNVLLESDLYINGGFIGAGTYVSSHMIFLNTPCYWPFPVSDTGVVWRFDDLVLGVMSDYCGKLEAASSGLLGAAGTEYSGAYAGRGLDGFGDGYTINGDTIKVCMTTVEPGDWIRVITKGHGPAPVPEPATMVLLGIGLIGMAALARKKMHTAA